MVTSSSTLTAPSNGEQAPNKFTPGPWRVERSQVRATLCVFGGPQFDTWICGELQSDNHTRIDTSECIANARLIAAAPDMLAALQLVTHDVRSGSLPTNIQKAIVAAIAKATGAA